MSCTLTRGPWRGSGWRDHINFYNSIEDCRIAAVCDVNQAARERAIAMIEKAKGYKPAEYADMRQMFESKDIDAVSLPLPNHWHALATIWACQAGKDVYVEKPRSQSASRIWTVTGETAAKPCSISEMQSVTPSVMTMRSGPVSRTSSL